MLTGVVHKGADGTIWFDDHPVRDPSQVPRRRAWRSTLWYATPSVTSADWGRIMGPEDVAFGPMPGSVLGVKFRIGKRNRFTVLDSSAWGVNASDPVQSFSNLQRMMAQAESNGIRVKNSVAATAVGVYMDRFDGTQGHPAIRQLPPRWRAMAHAALHGGPISVLQAGASCATQIDVRNAYLAALYEPMPVVGVEDGNRVGGWLTHDNKKWDRVRRLTGFVDASVRVSPDLDPLALPPLPVHLRHGSVYPRGELRGCWTIAQVTDAEERGEVEVLEVHQFCFAPQTRPLFAEVADLFGSLPKTLGKRLYTRFWGKFGSRGGYAAHKSEQPVFGEVPASGLWWKFDGIGLDSHRARPTYRPDLAAFVCASNHRRVISAMRELDASSVVACHVDAIWTTDLAGAAKLCAPGDVVGGWRPKRTGPLRFYGAGCYDHDGDLAASGYDSRIHGALSKDSLERWIQGTTHRRMLLQTRRWSEDPAVDPQATSRSLLLEMDRCVGPTEGPTVYDRCWSMNGWMRRDENKKRSEPLSSAAPKSVEAT
jgi:hypothetical protein